MSKSRIVVLLVVLILGAVWFLTPATDSAETQSTKTVGANSSLLVPPQIQRQMAQAPSSAPVSMENEKDGEGGLPPAPGEAALRAFQAESIRPWTARRMGSLNGIKTLVRGLWTSGNSSDSRASAEAFVHDYSESLLGVPADEIKFVREEVTDRTKIVYEQNVNGTPVFGGTLVLFFENGGMSRVQNDLFAKATILSAPPTNFDAVQAFAQFNATENSGFENLSGPDAKTILYPGPTSLIYAYEFHVRETATRKTYRVIYNAENPSLIKKFPSQIQ